MTRRALWKLYLFFALMLTVSVIAMPFFVDDGPTPWWDWLYIPLYLFQIIGLFGFVYRRRIALPRVWQLLFVASIGYEIWQVYGLVADPELVSNVHALSAVHNLMLPVLAAVYLLQIPLWVGMYLYAFRCQELWRGAT